MQGSVSGVVICFGDFVAGGCLVCSDVGIGKDGLPKDSFSRGMELRARVTLFGEGCRGSCSESLMAKFNLREVRLVVKFAIASPLSLPLPLLPRRWCGRLAHGSLAVCSQVIHL